MKIRAGRVAEAMEEAQKYLLYPAEILETAQTLAEVDEKEKALALARYGLKMPQEKGKADLAQWLRQQAEEMNRLALALKAAQTAFTASHTRMITRRWNVWRVTSGRKSGPKCWTA